MSKETTDHSVLLPPEPQEGGLILVKPGMKRNPNLDSDSANVEFKVPLPPSDNKPRVSMLGLDRLAEAKRRERLEQQQNDGGSGGGDTKKKSSYDEEPISKRSKVYSFKDGDVQEQEYSERRGHSDKSRSDERGRDDRSRHYRDRGEEQNKSSSFTPTPHRLYHQDFKDSRSSSSKSKGIYASSNKNGN